MPFVLVSGRNPLLHFARYRIRPVATAVRARLPCLGSLSPAACPWSVPCGSSVVPVWFPFGPTDATLFLFSGLESSPSAVAFAVDSGSTAFVDS